MDFAKIPPETVGEWYRFALLMTGQTQKAETVLLATCAELAPQLDQLRNENDQEIFLIGKIRSRCLEVRAVDAENFAAGELPLVRAVAALPEPLRSAMAMFYSRILPVTEMASVLKTSVEALADLLKDGRKRLKEADVFRDDPAGPPTVV